MKPLAGPTLFRSYATPTSMRDQGKETWRRAEIPGATMMTRLLLTLTLLASPLALAAQGNAPLPPPEQPFSVTGIALDADMVQLQWDIGKGYRLHQDNLSIETNTAGVRLDPPVAPLSPTGDYRGAFNMDIAVIRSDGAPQVLQLLVAAQACPEVGDCLPAHSQALAIELPTLAPNNNRDEGVFAKLSSIGKRLGLFAEQEKFLPPDLAFIMAVEAGNATTLLANWEIADGYYLYRDKFAFQLIDSDGVTLGDYRTPPGKRKVDETFGDTEVYYDHIAINVPLIRRNDTASDVTVEVQYQGCADAGFCYPPITKTIALALPPASTPGNTTLDTPISEQDRLAHLLGSGNVLLNALTFFGLGLLLAFTPCVLPMVPILSSIIVGQGEQVTMRKGFTLSLVYVLAMALTYTAAGVMAGLFGSNLQAAFQNPWILTSFSAIFVLLALSMFGFYELQMPSTLQTRLDTLVRHQKGGNVTGVAVMGFLSALIVGPCVAAPLAGALIYISNSGDGVLGGLALFSLSMGMGTPLLLIGTSTGKWLPKAGIWMNSIKAVFGVLLLAVAIWMMERVLPPQATMLLWAALLIVSAVYMGALEKLSPESTGWRKLWKGTGLMMLVYGAVIIVGVATGGKDVLQPLRGITFSDAATSPISSEYPHVEFKQVKGLTGLNTALEQAKAQGKVVMLDFYADWCVSCKEMERYTFSQQGVRRALANMVLLQTDVTANDHADQTLLKYFGIFGPPAILFFDPTGEELQRYRLVGFMGADDFQAHAEAVLRLNLAATHSF